MPRAEAVALNEEVMISLPDGRHGDSNRLLSTREAFDLVTQLLVAIDQARGYGQAIRGEVADPDRRSKHMKDRAAVKRGGKR